MLKTEKIETCGWEAAMRGMRNPKNSWDKSDSYWGFAEDESPINPDDELVYLIGPNDLGLASTLSNAGSSHRKFMRMIIVTMDITAPLYWWKEFDTYKIGTVADSCSTMHKIHAKDFTLTDFSVEHLDDESLSVMHSIIQSLNDARDLYNNGCKTRYYEIKPHDKNYWWQLIQLLPSSYNQKRTVQLNYEVIHNMYHDRKNHKLDEWHTLCTEFEKLPYFNEIILNKSEKSCDVK